MLKAVTRVYARGNLINKELESMKSALLMINRKDG